MPNDNLLYIIVILLLYLEFSSHKSVHELLFNSVYLEDCNSLSVHLAVFVFYLSFVKLSHSQHRSWRSETYTQEALPFRQLAKVQSLCF